MENINALFQKILRNKNLVTIIGIVIILILLYVGYSGQIKAKVKPVSVPVAASTIQPRTEITQDLVKTVDMPSISLEDSNVIRYSNQVIGKYSNINTVIPKGSMFYQDTVVNKEDLPDSAFVKVKKGETIFKFNVNMDSTYGNSIMPGNKIDIYMKTGNGQNEKVMIGKLIENIEVLAMKDSSGRNVFENTSEARTPSMMLFGLPNDIYILMMKAAYLQGIGVELFPVPHGGQVKTTGATEVSTQQLADYINARAVDLPTDQEEEEDTLAPKISSEGTTNKTVTIKYKKGCGSTYTCTYTIDDGQPVEVTEKKISVNFTKTGKISATLTEKDGTTHNSQEDITVDSVAGAQKVE